MSEISGLADTIFILHSTARKSLYKITCMLRKRDRKRDWSIPLFGSSHPNTGI